MSFEPPQHSYSVPAQPARKGTGVLWWFLGLGALLCIVCCGGLIAGLAYIGVEGPETSVYTGNQVPARYVKTMREVGALDPNENIRYFYSDSLVDIRDGFYFISNKKLVIFIDDGRESPLTVIPFDQIESTEIFRNESFFEDSEITVVMKDGEVLAFPVSSEFDRDQQFFDAIESSRNQ